MKSAILRRTALATVFAVTFGIGSATLAAPAGAAGATVDLTSTINPSVAGQRISLRVKIVDPTVPASTITGTATISDGSLVLGTAAVKNAAATYATATLAAGDHSITAAFTPTTGGSGAVSLPFVQSVTPADTTVALVTSKAIANYGDPGTITATVKAVAPGAGVATGSVDFFVDGGWYWTSYLDTRGKATLALADLYPSFYPGTYSITASYSGDTSYNPSAAAAAAQTFVGLSSPPITTLTLDANGLPVFNPRSFTLTSLSPVGCNVTIVNDTTSAQSLAYGTPGAWKRLPNGVIPAGGAIGVGVGMAPYTGYFTTVANTRNYVSLRCR